ncbi:hypothetical protein G9A89_014092 [Geosiphon pyriformis]|nr:hypothetical protein G9A89_014092 [Geosiphon pyriformis]
MTETYTFYTTYYFNQAYFENNFEERNNKEKSYQTALVFELLSSKSDLSTQTVIPEPIANNPIQANILAALQDIQTALGKKTIPHYHYSKTIHKIQLNSWMTLKEVLQPINMIINTSSKLLVAISKTLLLLELEKRTQGFSEVVTKYAKAIRKLIKRVDSGKNWTKEQKIHFFTKELRTDLSYAFWPLLALKNNPTIDMVIELAQRIEDNQKMHLRSILPQNQEEEQSNESDDNKSDKEKNQEKQEETVELAYTIFISNGKPLDNIKADKKEIIVNDKLICWFYYNIFMIENLARKQNTIIGGMAFVLSANAINLCILLIMNTSPA